MAISPLFLKARIRSLLFETEMSIFIVLSQKYRRQRILASSFTNVGGQFITDNLKLETARITREQFKYHVNAGNAIFQTLTTDMECRYRAVFNKFDPNMHALFAKNLIFMRVSEIARILCQLYCLRIVM
jgi:hypothetical protein